MAIIEFQEQLQRSSLGRVAFIGELYDMRTDSLSSLSLLKDGYPENLVKTTDAHKTEVEYKFTENASDRSKVIDVDAELQLTVFLGLLTAEGSGKFLNEEKESGKTISCCLNCQIQTINEKLFASSEDYINHVNLDVLKDPKYTHVVTEINWGVNCLLSLEFACESESSKEEIKGKLGAEFTRLRLLTLQGGGSLDKKEFTLLNSQDMKVKVFADIRPENGLPTTVEGFLEFLQIVPQLLRNVNAGRGKPLNYKMTSLSGIQQRAKLESAMNSFVRKIDESFLTSTISDFEEIGELKQKLHDLYALLKENEHFVREEELKGAGRMKAELALKESELKILISQSWVSVRSGEKTLNDLIKEIKQFKRRELLLHTYEEYLDSSSATVKKLSSVANFLSKGVQYLGKGETFTSVQARNPSSEFIVLVTSTEMNNEDPELHANTLCYFLVLAEESRPNTQYVVVDFDYTNDPVFSKSKHTVTKCLHLRGTQVLSRDLLFDYLSEIEGNFVRLAQTSTVDIVYHKPGNRVTLKIPCPGFKACSCPSDLVDWKCFACRSDVEYAFDNYYYCSCGRAPAHSFQYRCGNPKTHGESFVAANEEFLNSALSKLTPLDEMNVLVIGQSGVGKSTWINSIVNYLSYSSFDAAKENGVICTIPAEMTIYNPITLEKHIFRVGNLSDNEVTVSGHSATQGAMTYTFLWEGRCVRIIDTPGLGDSRGIDQDKENLSNIIEHIGYLKVLHGVCILLKSNDNRFNAIFTYCIKELLANLHKSVTKNIVFCFTSSRTSLYTPGQASVLLEQIIRNTGIERDLPLGRHNMFSLDNESFMFLCALNHTNIEFDDVVTQSYMRSWDVSFRETKRLFDTIKTFQPHLLEETVSLVTARNRVLLLTKPIAEVSKTIQMNVAVMEKRKKEIETSNLTIEELRKKLNFSIIQLEAEDLDYPRTVCTNQSCVEYHAYEGSDVSDTEYKTHCHVECYLKNVIPKTINNPELRECKAMDSSGKCQVCGCGWERHMHLTYSQKRVQKTVENKFVRNHISKEETEKQEKENMVRDMKETIEKYKKEQEIIIQASVKFGMFLKENAITVYNDSIRKYLEYLIDEEEKKPCRTATEKKIIKHLQDTLARYNEEVRVLTSVLQQNTTAMERINVKGVWELEKELYNLELTGDQIRQSVERSRSSNRAAHMYQEVPIYIAGGGKKVHYDNGMNRREKSPKESLPKRVWNSIKGHTPSIM